MARSKRTPGPKHNGPPLTDEEQDALATHFALRIIADQKIVAAKEGELRDAKKVVTGHFKLVEKELCIPKKEFVTDVLDVMGKTEAEYIASEKRRARRHQMAGATPVGAQLDLVERIHDSVNDEIDAESDGYRCGRRADDPTPPSHIAPILHPAWMRGWTRGQEVNGKCEAMAVEILERLQAERAEAARDPNTEGDDTNLNEEDHDEDAELDEEADRLRASGFMDTSEDDEEVEGAEPASFDGEDDGQAPLPAEAEADAAKTQVH